MFWNPAWWKVTHGLWVKSPVGHLPAPPPPPPPSFLKLRNIVAHSFSPPTGCLSCLSIELLCGRLRINTHWLLTPDYLLVTGGQFRLHWLFSLSHSAIHFGEYLLKNNTSYLLLGLNHASVNWISIVLMQVTPSSLPPPPPNELFFGIAEKSPLK